MLNNFTETELSHERWKPIFGYNGLYEVSDLGRVRSLKFGKVRVLRPGKDRGGYLLVVLCKDGKTSTRKVHRLVAQAFIENDDETKTQINHINECKSENKVSNLEYCTAQYNLTYNDLHRRRITKRDKIKGLYNPDITYRQNLEIFKANGIECTRQTLYNLRKDLGLIK